MCQICNLRRGVFDDARKSAFEQRMVSALNDAAMIVMTSVGHRTGLFDEMAGKSAASSVEIAERTGLDERYVREWLGAMVCSGVVEVDADTGRYALPDEHAAMLTRASAANMAVSAQFIALVGSVEDDVVACFRSGGGVPYSRYGRFHEVMAEESAQTVVAALEGAILPLVPGLQQRLREGISVLDVGCGRAQALLQLAEYFPRSYFTGFDLSEEAIAWARARARARGLANVSLRVRDLSDFDTTGPEAAFDLVTTFDAIHDQAKPAALLKGIRRALAEGGVYLAQDIKGTGTHAGDVAHPLGTLLYTISCMHCMTVSLAQGGDGLGAMWGEKLARQMFANAGFGSVEVHELEHDVMNYYYVCRA